MDTQGAQTGLRLNEGEDWQTTAHAVQMPLSRDWYCDGHGVLQATIKLRRIGWVDQKGRIWTEIPPSDEFDGGSLTALLINPGCE